MIRPGSLVMLVGLLWLAAVGPVAAETLDDLPEVVSEYARGKRLMHQGDFLGASRTFIGLIGRYPNSDNLDLFLFNRSKADYYFGNDAEALAGFSNFVARFPRSAYAAHANFYKANVYYRKGQLHRAFSAYIVAYRLSHDPRLDELVTTSLVAALDQAQAVKLSENDFIGLSETRRCQLVEPLAEALVRKEFYRLANDLLRLCGQSLDLPGADVTNALGSDLELAMLLPFSGELQSFGESIYQGAIIAAEMFRAETGRPLSLVPYDTKADPINAARIVRELERSTTDAVIGPLTSEEAAVTAAALGCGLLPTVAPAATQAGLTLLSESCFQLSPNIELQGVRAAQYAVANLGADSAAIMTPTSSDHLRMARAFADRFEQLGGTIVAVEYYRTRDKDFGRYLRDIKATLLGLHEDSTFFIGERGDTLDVEAIPVTLDCLYLPGSANQLRLLLPQINFYNLQAAYIGSDGWGDDALYRLSDNVVKGAVFPSPFLEQQRSPEYVKFAAAYDLRYGQQPHRLASLGYDAVRLIGMAVLNGATTRQELVDNLGLISKYRGAAADVTFGQYRENIELPMYQLIEGLPVYLGEGRAETASGEE